MENDLLAWLSLGACALLAVACVILYLDGKGQRRALKAAHAALEQQVAAQGAQLGILAQMLARVAPVEPRPEHAANVGPAFRGPLLRDRMRSGALPLSRSRGST